MAPSHNMQKMDILLKRQELHPLPDFCQLQFDKNTLNNKNLRTHDVSAEISQISWSHFCDKFALRRYRQKGIANNDGPL